MTVERKFAGSGLVSLLIDKGVQLAEQTGASVIRLDVDAAEPKLCSLYESFGFRQVRVVNEDEHITALYEKPVT